MDEFFLKSDCFNLTNTFMNGQCFRWNRQQDDIYEGVVFNKRLRLRQAEGGAFCQGGDQRLCDEYFDFATDYALEEQRLSDDDIMKTAVAAGSGMHILRQEPWEVLISFIISQNNNIPRIKKTIELLSRELGEKHTDDFGDFYSFPTPNTLKDASPALLSAVGTGYRAPYITRCARAVAEGAIDLKQMESLSDRDLKAALLSVYGIGEKVANCVMLFGFHRMAAFPVDTWIARTMNALYTGGATREEIAQYAQARFGKSAGLCQQYLFYASRCGALPINNQ